MANRTMEIRSAHTGLRSAGNAENPIIEAEFAVFDEVYDLGYCTESIDPHAFDDQLGEDIRALVDHRSELVLGRTTAQTLHFTLTPRALRGRVDINPNDLDAMNLWHRVQRGDVSQCSFGFDILEEERSVRNGKDHYLIRKIKLHEVSIVTFPAYKSTFATARSEQRRNASFAAWKLERERKISKWQEH
ncbi:MAG: HK97 family phage prohead protease [Clostridia bacterium]|nr:HK97 family phage prohead protease [Clostridia bacterium]